MENLKSFASLMTEKLELQAEVLKIKACLARGANADYLFEKANCLEIKAKLKKLATKQHPSEESSPTFLRQKETIDHHH